MLLVAVNGAADWDPHWLHNLQANASAVVEIDSATTSVHATILSQAQREAAWDHARRVFPGLDAAQEQTDRPIQVVRLTPR